MNKMDEILELLKCNLKKDEKKECPFKWLLAVIGAVVVVAAIAYGVYRFFSKEKEEELDEDFDEDFDDDFFEDEEIDQIVIPKQETEENKEEDLKVEEN